MNKPDCNTCQHADYSDNHFPTCPCDEMQKYKAHLENRRKYRRGDQITSLDILYNQEFAYMFGKPKHCGWIRSLQMQTAANAIKRGQVFYATRKQEAAQ